MADFTYDVKQLNLPYGKHTVTLQAKDSYKVGFVNSKLNTFDIMIGPFISVANQIISVNNLLNTIDTIDVYANNTKIYTATYDKISNPFQIPISELVGKVEDGKYDIKVKAIGVGVADNESNVVNAYIGNGVFYGVRGEPSESGTLERVEMSVGMNYTLNADGTINSDFDNALIFGDIRDVTDDKGNVFVRIPKHYTKYVQEADGTLTTIISNVKASSEFLLNPCFIAEDGTENDYIDIGKYCASGTRALAESKTGKMPLVNISIAIARTACMNNGAGYQQMDIWTWKMLQDLFKIEFATINSQNIMYGYCNNNSSAIASGRTDNVTTSSGSEVSNTDGKHAMKYRGIENLWGNVAYFIDGVNIKNREYFVCDKPSKYKSDTFVAPYTSAGVASSHSGNIRKLSFNTNYPFIQIPIENGGGNNQYYGDSYSQYDGNYMLINYSYWSYGSGAGLWFWNAFNGSGFSDSLWGFRLLKKPH